MINVKEIAEKAIPLFPMQSGEHIQTMEYLIEHLDSRENGLMVITDTKQHVMIFIITNNIYERVA